MSQTWDVDLINPATTSPATDIHRLVNGLEALRSNFSGASAPTETTPFMVWADTTTGLLKSRNADNTAWNTVGVFDGAGNLVLNNNAYLRGENSVGGNSKLIGRGSDDQLYVGDSTYNIATIIQAGIAQIQLNTSGLERMRIDSGGNVGIGTSSPSTQLHAMKVGNDSVLRLETDTAGKTAAVQMKTSAGGFLHTVGVETSPGGGLLTGSTAHAMVLATGGAKPIQFGVNDSLVMTIDASGNLKFNSGYGSVATAYGCRAWINFSGSGGISMRGAGNVSSVTYHGTGDYTVNFTTAMPDVNYALSCTVQTVQGGNKGFILQSELAAPAAGSCRLMSLANGATTTFADNSYIFATFFR